MFAYSYPYQRHVHISGVITIFHCVCGGGGGGVGVAPGALFFFLSWGHNISFVHLDHIKQDFL